MPKKKADVATGGNGLEVHVSSADVISLLRTQTEVVANLGHVQAALVVQTATLAVLSLGQEEIKTKLELACDGSVERDHTLELAIQANKATAALAIAEVRQRISLGEKLQAGIALLLASLAAWLGVRK